MNNAAPLTFRQKMVVVVMDVLLLVELTICVYLSHRDKESMVLVFLGSYVPLMLVTLLGARLAIRRMGKGAEVAATSDGVRA